METIGNFECNSGKLLATDPCYEKGIWCQVIIENARAGTWRAFAKMNDSDWGTRVAELHAYHKAITPHVRDWCHLKGLVGVDSGQAGIFDMATFPDNKGRHFSDPWYKTCCDTTSEGQAGVIPGGVVSRSGFGDGAYDIFVSERQGKVEAIRIVFFDTEMDDFLCGDAENS